LELEKKEGILKDIREENSKRKKDIEQGKARVGQFEERIRDLEQKEGMLTDTARERP